MSIAKSYRNQIVSINNQSAAKSDFIRIFVYQQGKVVFSNLTVIELAQMVTKKVDVSDFKANNTAFSQNLFNKEFSKLKAAIENVGYILEEYFDEAAYEATVRQTAEKINEVRNNFKQALFEKYRVSGERAETLYELSRNRTDDLEELETFFEEFSVLIR